MAKFDEILARIKDEHGDLAEELSTAYLEDMESRDATIDHLKSTTATQDAKIKEYAVQNYELMRKQPPADDDADTQDTPPASVSSADIFNHFRRA